MIKVLMAFSFMILSSSDFAQQSIRISPGSSITIDPGVETTVTCSGTGGQQNQILSYCYCDNSSNSSSYYLILVRILPGGSQKEQRLSVIAETLDSCNRNMASHSLCRK